MRTRLREVPRQIGQLVFGLALGIGLVAGGLGAPSIGLAAADLAHLAGPPRHPPIMPPSVPLGAPEHLAFFSYVEKINLAWGRDWPFVIRLFEEFDARYPKNPVVVDKLYASYMEHAKELWRAGDFRGARARLRDAIAYDSNRGEASELLAELDRAARAARGG